MFAYLLKGLMLFLLFLLVLFYFILIVLIGYCCIIVHSIVHFGIFHSLDNLIIYYLHFLFLFIFIHILITKPITFPHPNIPPILIHYHHNQFPYTLYKFTPTNINKCQHTISQCRKEWWVDFFYIQNLVFCYLLHSLL